MVPELSHPSLEELELLHLAHLQQPQLQQDQQRPQLQAQQLLQLRQWLLVSEMLVVMDPAHALACVVSHLSPTLVFKVADTGVDCLVSFIPSPSFKAHQLTGTSGAIPMAALEK
jgi:hypothetical protein